MGKFRVPVFDGDGHVLEEDGELLQHYEGRFKDLRLQRTFGIWPTLDGWARGVIHSTEDAGRKYFHTNADIWREMLDLIGVEGTVLYPTAGLACGLISDVEWATATAIAYNNWLEDRYTSQDERFFGAGLLAVQNPQAAAAESATNCRVVNDCSRPMLSITAVEVASRVWAMSSSAWRRLMMIQFSVFDDLWHQAKTASCLRNS